MVDVGVIGWSGIFKGDARKVKTDYGAAEVAIADVCGRKIAVIARHGRKHDVPPHGVNYKANMAAMKKTGVKFVIGTAACGSITRYGLGDIVLVRDFIGFHLGLVTFFDKKFSVETGHVDMHEPYDPGLCSAIVKAARKEGVPLKDGGIIAGTVGPRFETKAEIEAFRRMGANLVNMTNVYEAVLANELGLRYAALAVVTNPATGTSRKPPGWRDAIRIFKKRIAPLKRIISATVGLV